MSLSESLLRLVYSSSVAQISAFLKHNEICVETALNSRRQNAMHVAALANSLAMAKHLLSLVEKSHHATWVNSRSEDDFTPLHFACYRGNLVRPTQKLARLLVECGADVTAVNREGLQPVHIAAQGDHAQAIEYLHTIGVSMDSLDLNGFAPIHWSAFLGNELATMLLLARGVSVSIKEQNGNDPLHLATQSGNARVVRHLLLRGADPETLVRST
jgi:palmitoyltransferase